MILRVINVSRSAELIRKNQKGIRCSNFAFTASRSQSMVSVRGRGRIFRNPLGVGGLKVFDWFSPTHTWQQMPGNEDGETGVDDNVAARGFENIGAYILGRNMFGPVRRDWPEEPHEW